MLALSRISHAFSMHVAYSKEKKTDLSGSVSVLRKIIEEGTKGIEYLLKLQKRRGCRCLNNNRTRLPGGEGGRGGWGGGGGRRSEIELDQ